MKPSNNQFKHIPYKIKNFIIDGVYELTKDLNLFGKVMFYPYIFCCMCVATIIYSINVIFKALFCK